MEFTVRYPEFASVAPARIEGALQDAANQMSRKVWNKLYEQGLHALAAHLLYAAGALTPSGSSNGKPHRQSPADPLQVCLWATLHPMPGLGPAMMDTAQAHSVRST